MILYDVTQLVMGIFCVCSPGEERSGILLRNVGFVCVYPQMCGGLHVLWFTIVGIFCIYSCQSQNRNCQALFDITEQNVLFWFLQIYVTSCAHSSEVRGINVDL